MKEYSNIAFVNSIESMGALDGPGLRTVVFLQGCSLKCKFCHNVECLARNAGKTYKLEELEKLILSNKAYFGKNGGVTFSGGEPTLQSDFINRLGLKLKKSRVNIAIDTSLFTSEKKIDSLLPIADYWMVSIKHMDALEHKNLTGFSNTRILENIKYLDSKISKSKHKPKIRVRYLVINGLTDSKKNIAQMIDFIKQIKNLDCVELLAYNSQAKEKWIKLYGHYDLEGISDTSLQKLKAISNYFNAAKVKNIYAV